MANGLFGNKDNAEEYLGLGAGAPSLSEMAQSADTEASIIGNAQPKSRFQDIFSPFQNILSKAAMGQIPMGSGGPTAGFVTPAQTASCVVATEAARQMLFSPERPSFSQAIQQQADQPFVQAAFADSGVPATAPAPAPAPAGLADFQKTFEERKATGEPLTAQEIGQAKIFAGSMGRTFDPEKGYGEAGSAAFIPGDVAATQQALLRQFGAPTISQIQDLDQQQRKQRVPSTFEDEAKARKDRIEAGPDFMTAVPTSMTGQTGGSVTPTAANVPSEIQSILLKPAQRRTEDEIDRLARFNRSTLGQSLGGIAAIEESMMGPIQSQRAELGLQADRLRFEQEKLQLENAGFVATDVETDPETGVTVQIFKKGDETRRVFKGVARAPQASVSDITDNFTDGEEAKGDDKEGFSIVK